MAFSILSPMLICIAEIFSVLGGKVPRKLTRVPQKKTFASAGIKWPLFVNCGQGWWVLHNDKHKECRDNPAGMTLL